jgi:hypothetical protein
MDTMRRLLTLSALMLGLAGCCHDTCDSCRDICTGCHGCASSGKAMHLAPVPGGMPVGPVVAPHGAAPEQLRMQPREQMPAPPAEAKPGQ